MKTMPCLFNRWHDEKWDYGGLYIDDLYRDYAPKLEYVKTLVKPLAEDPRILIWDLCNEPNAMNLDEKWSQYELKFLTQVAATVRECRVKQPIMIGTQHTTNIEIYAPLCDVLGYHPYVFSPEHLQSQIESSKEIGKKFGKPVLVNESMPGCLDDNRRAALVKYYTEMLSAAGFGWMGWALREGKAVSTRRDRYDYNGIDREGYHPYFTREGKLRGGLDFLREKPKLLPPWEK
jgi:endo-1,4-beta-mannosidase